MYVLIGLGAFYTMYGILGLLGIQYIPKKHRNQPWTRQYKRSCGVGWLLFGIPWCVLYFVARQTVMKTPLLLGLIVVCSLPSMVYSVICDRKYDAMLR